jgi:hypothetical protein
MLGLLLTGSLLPMTARAEVPDSTVSAAVDTTAVDSLKALPKSLVNSPLPDSTLYREAYADEAIDDTIPAPWDDQMIGEELNYVNDSIPPLVALYDSVSTQTEWYEDDKFNPIPAKAVWYAALFPGGGQIYNRKYWKLPIIYGGFLGLLYGYQWNNRYYKTYSNAYRDLVLGSPNASYKDFLPPSYDVVGRHDYLERVFKRKKNSYRNYRDYCVVGMLGVYLVAMVDAYVDASLYHFDVSPDLGINNEPVLRLSYTYNF